MTMHDAATYGMNSWKQRYAAKIRRVEDGFFAPIIRDNCGTILGYKKHINSNEVPCDKCKDAKAIDSRLRDFRFKEVMQQGDLDRPGLPPLDWKSAEDEVRTKTVKRNKSFLDILDSKDPRHGTEAGFRAHITIDDKPCDRCHQVALEKMKIWRKENPLTEEQKAERLEYGREWQRNRYKNDAEYRKRKKQEVQESTKRRRKNETPEEKAQRLEKVRNNKEQRRTDPEYREQQKVYMREYRQKRKQQNTES